MSCALLPGTAIRSTLLCCTTDGRGRGAGDSLHASPRLSAIRSKRAKHISNILATLHEVANTVNNANTVLNECYIQSVARGVVEYQYGVAGGNVEHSGECGVARSSNCSVVCGAERGAVLHAELTMVLHGELSMVQYGVARSVAGVFNTWCWMQCRVHC